MTREEQIHTLEDKETQWNVRVHALQDQLQHADPKLQQHCQRELERLKDEWHQIRTRLAGLRLDQAESYHDDNFLTAFHQVFDEIGAKVDHVISSLTKR